MREVKTIRKRFAAVNQAHIFAHWDRLSPSGRQRLLRQAAAIDLKQLSQWCQSLIQDVSGQAAPIINQPIEPSPYLTHPCHGGDKTAWQQAAIEGATALRAGKVAAFTVAGGQGTRLGFDGPKGILPITPIHKKTLLQVFAEKIHGVTVRYGVTPPWLILTSPDNHNAIQDFLEKNAYFGLNTSRVHCLCQGQTPAVDRQGKLLLKTADSLMLCPDGHGGALSALWQSGLLTKLNAAGITIITYAQVDNPLVYSFDPAFIGLHLRHCSDMSSKMVTKRSADEKVGVFVRNEQGHLAVIEYSDMPETLSTAWDEQGERDYTAGNTAIHLLSVDFAKRMGDPEEFDALPVHRADKIVEHFDPLTGKLIPIKGVKFERFIFDALPYAQRAIVVETLREEEFSPVKNKTGPHSR